MRTERVLTLLALPVAAMLAMVTSCARSQKSWQLPQPVRIEGGDKYACYFPSLMSSSSTKDTGGTGGLLVRDGDLIACKDIPFVYLASDGMALKLTREKWGVRLADRIVSVSLTQGEDKTELGREWLEKASAQELAAVRLIKLPKDLDAACMPALKQLAAANLHVAVFAESNSALVQALPLFQPRLLFIVNEKEPLDANVRELLANQKELETLFVGDESANIGFLRTLPSLRRLWISDWTIDKAGPLPPGLTGLRSLTMFGSDAKDLAALNAAPLGLEELSLMGCGELVDVKVLARFSVLKALIFTGSEKVLDLSGLAGLKQLQWVGLPPKISQEQFAAFLKDHPNLRILEMVGCEHVTDLAPLRDLRNLEGLILGESYKNLEVLQGLKSLRFVGLSEEMFKDSPEQVAALKKALPDTLIVPASTGACLGSGWILLLIPTVVLWRLFQRRRATGPHHV